MGRKMQPAHACLPASDWGKAAKNGGRWKNPANAALKLPPHYLAFLASGLGQDFPLKIHKTQHVYVPLEDFVSSTCIDELKTIAIKFFMMHNMKTALQAS